MWERPSARAVGSAFSRLNEVRVTESFGFEADDSDASWRLWVVVHVIMVWSERDDR